MLLLQLEKQIEQIRRELEEAKKGVLLKAQQRMDEIEESANNLKAQVSTSQGIIQVCVTLRRLPLQRAFGSFQRCASIAKSCGIQADANTNRLRRVY